jgi:glutaminyl-tRNA synthetase
MNAAAHDANDPTRTGASAPSGRATPRDFLRAIFAEDVAAGTHGGRVATRFPPEPNGFLHIGHAKSITLNFGIAREFGGVCHLRFDDTNPETEDVAYVESIIETVRWLGYDWGEHLYYASDYFEQMYGYAEELIGKGLAYVDSIGEEEMRELRGTITEPGRPSPHRDRPVEENLDLFRRMRAGEFPDGTHVLRGRIDLASKNMLMRDPVLYRIRHAHHYRTGDDWCIYPLYDYAHPLEDAIEGITHSLCTLEFDNNRELYDWVVENTSVPSRPRQYEFARLNLDYTVMSKRKLLQLVTGGHVSGWDDPRLPTVAGLRRRGVTPEAIRTFCEMIGVTKTESRVDIGKLEYAIRDDLNRRVPRVLCVPRPLRVVLTSFPDGAVEELDAPLYPHDVPLEGSRPLPLTRVLYIDRDDFSDDPPRGYNRLVPGGEVRLRYACIIRCDEVIRDGEGQVVELRCTHDATSMGGPPADGRRVKGTIQWVSAEHSVPCELRLYDRLFTVPDPDAAAGEEGDFTDFLNPDSLVVLPDARIEPAAAGAEPGARFQFERVGYFCADAADSRPGASVFNRIVTLRDTWARGAARREPAAADAGAADSGAATGTATQARPEAAAPSAADAPPARPLRTAALSRREAAYRELGLGDVDAAILTRDEGTAALFDAALAAGAPAQSAAKWIINEVARELKGRDAAALPFGGAELAALIGLIDAGTLSSGGGREVLAELAATGGDPAAIVERRGLAQISDTALLAPLARELVALHPERADAYRAGRTGLLGFFVGQVMARTQGRANPELVREILERELG